MTVWFFALVEQSCPFTFEDSFVLLKSTFLRTITNTLDYMVKNQTVQFDNTCGSHVCDMDLNSTKHSQSTRASLLPCTCNLKQLLN